jgi:hypothetical protein
MKKANIIVTLIVTIRFIAGMFPLPARAQQMTDYTGQVFPANHALNMPINSLPVHPNSDAYVATIGANTALHPDFGTYYNGYPMGISYNVVGAGQAKISLTFEYESDPGPYPIPIPPFVEGLNTYTDNTDGDRHILVIDTNSQRLYETWYSWPPGHSMPDPQDWSTYPPSNPSNWWAGSGAVFDLTSNGLRPDGWTSGDAAGLPIFPLLIRYDEVEHAMLTDSIIHHAVRFTIQHSQKAYIWPARHFASSSVDTSRPPMGLRFRLKAAVDISGFSSRMQVILRTMKKYGLIVADNGSNWFFQGTHDDRWDDTELNSLKNLHGSDFEAVDIRSWMERPGFDANSAAVPSVSATVVSPIENSQIPLKSTLYQNYPNPFNPSTTIRFYVPQTGHAILIIYDLFGRQVRTLLDNSVTPGEQLLQWDGSNTQGKKVDSGVYFYQLKTESGFTKTLKMILLN